MLADLHIHSWYSDSTRSPKEIVALAKSKGMGLISICDHNMVDGYDEIIMLARDAELDLIVGAEINSVYDGTEFHILAYGFDMDDHRIKALMKYNKKVMDIMGYTLIGLIQRDYPNVSISEFVKYQRKRENGGWASIDYLIYKGIVSNFGQYVKFCKKYSVNIKGGFKSIDEITSIIHKAGGKAVLAHAGDMIDNEPVRFKAMLVQLLAQGIDGFECYYTSHCQNVTRMLLDFCEENNLLVTAGSDDHGGFNNVINGKEYYIGCVEVIRDRLNLAGIAMRKIKKEF